MTEEESHETSHSTSVESGNEERQEVEQKEVDIKKTKLYHTLTPWKKFSHTLKEVSLLYFFGFIVSLFLFGLKHLIVYARLDGRFYLYRNETKVQYAVSDALSVVSSFIFAFTLIDTFLYYMSGYLMEKVNFLTLAMFYTNSVSSLLSSMILVFGSVVYCKFNEVDYKIKESHSVGIEQSLTTCFLSLLVITMKDIFVKKVRMGFNHTNYLSRIQKCLIEHQFIKTLEVVRKRIKGQKNGKKKRYWMFSQPAQDQQAGAETDTPSQEEIPEDNEKYFKPKFMAVPEDLTDVKQKMIIFKEFEKIMNTKIYHMDKGIGAAVDIKQESQKRAEKIATWLAADRKKFQIRHLKKYVDSEYVDNIVSVLGLSETQLLSEKDIATLIEKTKREKYAVKRSLVQMDKALLRVSHFITGSIFVFAAIALLSPTISANDVVKGVFGTFFGLGFIFQTSVKNAIDSVIFLFIVHPYDIGDRIRVEIDKEELNMVVSELNVFSTVFYEWNGSKIYIPNHVLLQKSIVNVRRSGLMAENIVFQVSFDTVPEKIQHLKTEITKFIKKHPKDFSPYFMFNYHALEDTNKLHLKIYLQHATNWQNYEAYLQRKAKFIMFLKQAISEQKIEYYLPIQRLEIIASKTAQTSL
ncbi:mechanosensitive ion channel protein 4/5/6/7/8/9/10 [Nematocida minor]|uniref:mechanosensitive ion channel protein 4/5/6/7/8/9/10 n=1 Tax=Nematocida minor TaxID=1912983 RepID=UPI0022201843|nr:mechanosensitive ion channel protein 4/5/6/7/8/9/10 [Nematocida minor]KAI5189172.1 mechanosensitive ion channel protein 4/5/6/7/8/9/10 [Nematocida minor]